MSDESPELIVAREEYEKVFGAKTKMTDVSAIEKKIAKKRKADEEAASKLPPTQKRMEPAEAYKNTLEWLDEVMIALSGKDVTKDPAVVGAILIIKDTAGNVAGIYDRKTINIAEVRALIDFVSNQVDDTISRDITVAVMQQIAKQAEDAKKAEDAKQSSEKAE